MTRFDIVSGESRVWIDASSSIHPIHVEASELEGYLEASFDGGRVDTDQPVAGRVEVEVRELESGNKLIDKETARRLEVGRHPRLTGELQELGAGAAAQRYRAEGDLTVRGQTQRVSGELAITEGESPGTVIVEGEREFDVRDFGLEPPRLMGLKVHPEVRVRLRAIAKEAACSPQ